MLALGAGALAVFACRAEKQIRRICEPLKQVYVQKHCYSTLSILPAARQLAAFTFGVATMRCFTLTLLSVLATGISADTASAIEWRLTGFYWEDGWAVGWGGGRVSLDGTRTAWFPDRGSSAVYYDGARLWDLGSLAGAYATSVADVSGAKVAFVGQKSFVSEDQPYGQNLCVFDGAALTWVAQSQDRLHGMQMSAPRISGSNVVWTDGLLGVPHQVYLYDGQSIRQISNDEYSKDDVRVSGGNVLWHGLRGQESHLFLYNGQTTVQLGESVGDETYALSGSNVAWVERVDGADQVFLYDGTTTRQISHNPVGGQVGEAQPHMDGSNVVWDWHGQEGNRVYLYDGDRVLELAGPLGQGNGPLVSGVNVAWGGLPNATGIMFYDGANVSEVGGGRLLALSGQNMLWEDSGGMTLATVTPEPGAGALFLMGTACVVALAARSRRCQAGRT
jgi:hypothetical protein